MIRNECCNEYELLTLCVADSDGNVEQFYKCPICGRAYKEKTVTLCIGKKTNIKKLPEVFLKKNPDCLIVRKNILTRKMKRKTGENVNVRCLNIGYI